MNLLRRFGNSPLSVWLPLAMVAAFCLIFPACATPGASNATAKGLPGATVAPVNPDARALRIVRLAAKGTAFAILQNNPSHIDAVVAFGAAWDVFAHGREITEEEIATFVAEFARGRGLKDAAVLVLYTDLAREVLTLIREQTGSATLNLGDARTQAFVAAAREGIRGAIVLVRAFQTSVGSRSRTSAEAELVTGHAATMTDRGPEVRQRADRGASFLTVDAVYRGPSVVVISEPAPFALSR